MENEFYLSKEQMCQAIGMYLLEEGKIDIEEGSLVFEYASNGFYKVNVFEEEAEVLTLTVQ